MKTGLYTARDPFLFFPISLRNIDGAIDVFVGVLGATLAFMINANGKMKGSEIAKVPQPIIALAKDLMDLLLIL